MQDSLFTKIIKGAIPCHKVYEDDKILIFMDIHPIQPGHVLVVPKQQVGNFFDLLDEDYQALMAGVKKVATQLKSAFPEKKRICVIVEGFDVLDHAHIKVFPADSDSQFRFLPNMADEPNHSALAKLAKTLAF